MKRLLVTGARGFIGRACLTPALAAGYEVHAVVARRGQPVPMERANLFWRQADLLAPGEIERLLDECAATHVLHLGWETAHGAYWTSPANLDWLAFGARFFRAFAARGGRRFVSAGTCAEYDWSRQTPSEDEGDATPQTFYGRIKLLHHRALMASAEQFGFSAATGRVFFGYGPHEHPDRVIAHACRRLAQGRVAHFSSGRQRRDFLHVRDIGAGFVALLESDFRGACDIASGVSVSIAEMLEIIGAVSGRPDLLELGALADRPCDPPVLVGDNRRLLRTGWRASVPLNEGLAETYRWWAEACARQSGALV